MTGRMHRDAKPGDQFHHTETGTVATFVEWRGQLMVLHHPTFGECRWHPVRAQPLDGELAELTRKRRSAR